MPIFGSLAVYSGRFYLELMPATYIDRIAVDAKADGNLNLDIYTANLKVGNTVSVQLESLEGKKIGMPFVANVGLQAIKR